MAFKLLTQPFLAANDAIGLDFLLQGITLKLSDSAKKLKFTRFLNSLHCPLFQKLLDPFTKSLKFVSFGVGFILLVVQSFKGTKEDDSDGRKRAKIYEKTASHNGNSFEKLFIIKIDPGDVNKEEIPLESKSILSISVSENRFLILSEQSNLTKDPLNASTNTFSRTTYLHLLEIKSDKTSFTSELEQILIPSDCPEIKSIALSRNHFAFVSGDGRVFTWGKGLYGALGHGDLRDVAIPKNVSLLNGMYPTMVSCGIWHTVVLTKSGAVYSFGSNKNGQLGVEKKGKIIFDAPVLMDLPESLSSSTAVGCGRRTTYFVSDLGKVSYVGWDFFGNDKSKSITATIESVLKDIYAVGEVHFKKIPTYFDEKRKSVASISPGEWSLLLELRDK